ncbi:hypothetical protein C8Q75DRAFT_115195 [Abortiporus biennis]|nr:hypothetical protein C8Q75DRAFT_115195 [Abortiporus biennis]
MVCCVEVTAVTYISSPCSLGFFLLSRTSLSNSQIKMMFSVTLAFILGAFFATHPVIGVPLPFEDTQSYVLARELGSLESELVAREPFDLPAGFHARMGLAAAPMYQGS